MCIFEVLARPRVGVCVPLAFCMCHCGLFPSYVAQGLCFKAGLSAKLLNNIKLILMQINLIFTGKVLHLASCVGFLVNRLEIIVQVVLERFRSSILPFLEWCHQSNRLL